MSKYIFPTIMILLNLGAAVVCGSQGDVRKVIYWIAAAVINAVVTFQEVAMAKKDCEKCKTCIHSGLCSKETNRKVYTGKLKMSPCEKCDKSKITRPPQSWCYVESEVDTE